MKINHQVAYNMFCKTRFRHDGCLVLLDSGGVSVQRWNRRVGSESERRGWLWPACVYIKDASQLTSFQLWQVANRRCHLKGIHEQDLQSSITLHIWFYKSQNLLNLPRIWDSLFKFHYCCFDSTLIFFIQIKLRKNFFHYRSMM